LPGLDTQGDSLTIEHGIEELQLPRKPVGNGLIEGAPFGALKRDHEASAAGPVSHDGKSL